MPNPKTGTVTMDIKGAVADIKRGKIAYRVDRDGNLNIGIGRVSFSEKDLLDNLVAITDAIVKARPSTVKGTYIRNCVVSSTMGPGVKVTFAGRN
jgi:large subunit ribosomal protein L1